MDFDPSRVPWMKRVISTIAVLVMLYAWGREHLDLPLPGSVSEATGALSGAAHRDVSADIAAAYAARRSDVAVEGEGAVAKLLADDRQGSRHQRFILRLASGHTLLVAHNIDLAPRLEGLEVGDTVRFAGEYEWNDKGGVLHWTHHDPRGQHPGGWLELDGRRYE